MAVGDLVTTELLQWWLKTGVSTFTRVTEDSEFTPDRAIEYYEPKYKDRAIQPTYKTGETLTINAVIDVLEGATLQEYLLTNEDVSNVATELVRVFEAHPCYPAWVASTAYALGDHVVESGKLYVVTTAGTSAASPEPTWPASGTVTDGTVTWTYVSAGTHYPVGAEGGYEAKKAAFVMNIVSVDGAAGEAVQITAEFKMTDTAWTYGTFAPATATFTPDA